MRKQRAVDGRGDAAHAAARGRRHERHRQGAPRFPDRPVAGKTGTTENYGDAWFVGYTPQLVTAVWVGYPNRLRPMLTEFHGGPVAGGTFPAQIWKAFMESALKAIGAQPASFPSPPYLSVDARSASRIATARSSSTTAAAAST